MDRVHDSFLEHIPEDLLEAYALGKTADLDLAYIEEHLLVCEPCRARLVEAEGLVAVIRQTVDQIEAKSGVPVRYAAATSATKA